MIPKLQDTIPAKRPSNFEKFFTIVNMAVIPGLMQWTWESKMTLVVLERSLGRL
jgi:hypothetical protein